MSYPPLAAGTQAFLAWASSATLLTWLLAMTIATFLLALIHAALALLYRARAARKQASIATLHERWRPHAVRFVMGDGSPLDMARRVSPGEAPIFLDFLLDFTRRLAAHDVGRARTLAAPFLPSVKPRRNSRRPGVRAQSLQILAELGGPAFADDLVAALRDPSPLVAMVAARMLCRTETAHRADAVLSHLHRFRSWAPTLLAAMLAAAGPSTAPALREALSDGRRASSVRVVAARALYELNDFPSADIAAMIIQVTGDVELRVAGLRLLARVGRGDHLPVVRAQIDAGQFAVRMAAVDAIAALGGPAELDRLEQIVKDDPSSWVAIHAARGLLRAGRPGALRVIAATDHARASTAAQVLAEGGRR